MQEAATRSDILYFLVWEMLFLSGKSQGKVRNLKSDISDNHAQATVMVQKPLKYTFCIKRASGY